MNGIHHPFFVVCLVKRTQHPARTITVRRYAGLHGWQSDFCNGMAKLVACDSVTISACDNSSEAMFVLAKYSVFSYDSPVWRCLR